MSTFRLLMGTEEKHNKNKYNKNLSQNKDNKKIAFIYCVNNEAMYEKSVAYLKKLEIPEGYSVEYIKINNANSITEAYNDEMKSNNAKYKIYLHQDVFILNKNFINDIIRIFESDKKIGILGVIGSKDISQSGTWWRSEERYGKVYDSSKGIMKELKFNEIQNEYEDVSAVDGLLIATQYDIPWRDDIIKGWHFYDVSQCQEFIKRGLKVVIPKQKSPWCKHDCGITKIDKSYRQLRAIFVKEYLKNNSMTEKVSCKKRVCFSCLNSYHLFISYILSKTVYMNDYKILMLSDHHENVKKAYKNIINKFNIWDEVILIQDRSKGSRHQQLKKIDFDNLDILHYFTYAFYNYLLFDYIKERTKIILTEEGVMTYLIKESFETSKLKPIDIERVSEIWVLDKNLYVSSLNRPVKNLEMEKYILNDKLLADICYELNEIFDYWHEEIDSDIIFFDQPFSKVGLATKQEEKRILSEILDELNDYKVLIKKHPSDSLNKYKDFNVNIIKDNGVPWELVLLNECINNKSNLYNKVFLSYHSAALINTTILLNTFKIPFKSIFLYKLLENSIKRTVTHKLFEKFIVKFKESYGKDIYNITSIDELRNELSKF